MTASTTDNGTLSLSIGIVLLTPINLIAANPNSQLAAPANPESTIEPNAAPRTEGNFDHNPITLTTPRRINVITTLRMAVARLVSMLFIPSFPKIPTSEAQTAAKSAKTIPLAGSDVGMGAMLRESAGKMPRIK